MYPLKMAIVHGYVCLPEHINHYQPLSTTINHYQPLPPQLQAACSTEISDDHVGWATKARTKGPTPAFRWVFPRPLPPSSEFAKLLTWSSILTNQRLSSENSEAFSGMYQENCLHYSAFGLKRVGRVATASRHFSTEKHCHLPGKIQRLLPTRWQWLHSGSPGQGTGRGGSTIQETGTETSPSFG